MKIFSIKNKFEGMIIDENEQWKLKKYAKKVTKSDHHTIIVKLKVQKSGTEKIGKNLTRYNLKNEEARKRMRQNIELDTSLERLFIDPNCDLNKEVELFMKKWNENIAKSFHKVKPSKNRRPGVTPEVKELLKKETWIRSFNVTEPTKHEKGFTVYKVTYRVRDNDGYKISKPLH